MTHSFPTRRSSDLEGIPVQAEQLGGADLIAPGGRQRQLDQGPLDLPQDAVVEAGGRQAAVVRGEVGAQVMLHRTAQRFGGRRHAALRSEEHTSELQSLMRISYAVFCLKKKK